MDRLDGLIRAGRVSSVDEKQHTAQVEFTEGDGVVSYDLPVLVTRPGDYALPEKDAEVVCLMLPGNGGFGFILGAFYSEADAPPLSDAGQRSVVSEDLRLGTSDAKDKIALAPATKTELDKLKKALDQAKTDLGKLKDYAKSIADYLATMVFTVVEAATVGPPTPPFTGTAPEITLDPKDPESVAAEKVTAK